MKKLIKKILILTNLGLAILLILSSISVYINPAKFWPPSFLGIAYPYFLMANLIFILFWIIKKKKYLGISLLAIIFTWNSFAKMFQMGIGRNKLPDNKKVTKIMSYNVRLFNHYKWVNDINIANKIFQFIKNEKPDILCLQEFYTLGKEELNENAIKKKLKLFKNAHIEYTHQEGGTSKYGLATFSRYPVVGKGKTKFYKSVNGFIFSDLKIGNDTIRVFNCHLQSIRINRYKINLIDSVLLHYNTKHIDDIKHVSRRLKNAYIIRAKQAKQLDASIKKSPYPVIVCGDFNDTPVSYAYKTIRGKLKDAFLESGKGFGNTYFGKLPSFRIDYILHDKKIESYRFRTKKLKLSDHFPVVCDFATSD